MSFKNRVTVLNSNGMFVMAVPRARAIEMVDQGQARRTDDRIVVLTASAIRTREMDRIPIKRIRRPHADSSTGDAGRGNTLVPRYRGLHTPGAPISAVKQWGRVIGYRCETT